MSHLVSSKRLIKHPPYTSPACQIRSRRGGETLASITDSDFSSPSFPLQINTQSIQQWINNERCRTTTLHGPSWFQPFNASVTSCLVQWYCMKQREYFTYGNENKSNLFITFFWFAGHAGAKHLTWLVRLCVDRPVVSVKAQEIAPLTLHVFSARLSRQLHTMHKGEAA